MEFNATFLVSAISFLVFVFLMNKIFYAPLERIITEREKLVDDTLNDAKNSRNETTRLLEERDSKLVKASEDSKSIINKKVTTSNEEAKKRTFDAKKEAEYKLNELKKELDNHSESVKNELQDAAKEIAAQITTKIFG